jgi:membrane associated rhomboid family serine protease
MILPIGHEESEVRRLPWVTIAIMALCVLMLLATNPAGEFGEQPEPDLSPVGEAASYWRDHPYLKAPPEVITEVSYDVAPNQRSQYIGMLRTSSDPPDPSELALEQAQLDAILRGERTLAEGEDAAPAPPSPYKTWGLTASDPTARGFFTHMFMHAGWFHLIGNLFMLFLAGPALEDRWGRPLYTAFYVTAGLASGAFFISMEQGNAPLVGASGAIAGVLGAFLVRYAKTQIRFFYFFFIFRILTGTFSAPAWAVLPLWFGNELLAAYVGTEDGVAYWAHVGGFLFGVATGLAIKQLRLEERFDAKIEGKISVRGSAATLAALELRESGDVEGAFAKLAGELASQPADADAAIAYWDAAVSLGRAESSLPTFLRTIKALLPAQADEAARCWLELSEHAPDVLLEPMALLAIHKSLAAQGREAEAKRALRHAADPKNRALTPALALRVLDAARDQDPQAAAWAARFVVDSPQVADEKKAKLRAQLAELEAKVPPPEAPPAPRRTAPIDIGLDDGSADAPSAREPYEAEEANEPFSQEIGRMLDADALGGGESADTEADLPAVAAPEPEVEAEPELGDEELGAILGGPRFADAKVTEAAPKGLDERGVVLALAGGGSGRIAFEKIQAVAVAAVAGLSARPVVLIDLLLNRNAVEGEALRVVRLRSDKFDPRLLAPGAASPLDALRAFLGDLLARSGATALPDPEGARAKPLRSFADLASYQRDVLEVA